MTTPTAAMNREHPLLFAQQFIPKLLSGEKTETRRPIKPQPPSYIDELHGNDLRGRAPYPLEHPETGAIIGYGFQDDNDVFYKIPWRVGDTIWAKETFKFFGCANDDGQIEYQGDRLKDLGPSSGDVPNDKLDIYFRWVDKSRKKKKAIVVPSILMPRFAARIFLKVTDVRVERLQEITQVAAEAEGITDVGCFTCGKSPCGCHNPLPSAKETFIWNWHELYGYEGPLSWHSNPWVSVTQFSLVKP